MVSDVRDVFYSHGRSAKQRNSDDPGYGWNASRKAHRVRGRTAGGDGLPDEFPGRWQRYLAQTALFFDALDWIHKIEGIIRGKRRCGIRDVFIFGSLSLTFRHCQVRVHPAARGNKEQYDSSTLPDLKNASLCA
jgi:hypothetical protein